MSFAHYKAPKRVFPMSDKEGQSVTLTGLSLVAIASLLEEHIDDLESLWSLAFSGRSISVNDYDTLAPILMTHAPGLVANIIALAAGLPEEAPLVEKMSAPRQIEMLIAIGDLTFEEVGGVKKCMEMVSGLMKNMMGQTATVKKTVKRR
jgi:hypothetical protein